MYIQSLVTTTGLHQAQGQLGADLSPSRVYLPCQHPWPSEQTNTRVFLASVQAVLVWLTNSLSPFFWDYVFQQCPGFDKQPARMRSQFTQAAAASRDAPSSSPSAPALQWGCHCCCCSPRYPQNATASSHAEQLKKLLCTLICSSSLAASP